MLLGFNNDDLLHDVESALVRLTSLTLGDQDRAEAFIQHDVVQDWILDPRLGAILVHGNGRRPDAISPMSVSCAMLIHIYSRKLPFPTLYWFCGLHSKGPHGNPLGMVKSLICQLLCSTCCELSPEDQCDPDKWDLKQLLKLFVRLLQESSGANPIVCIIDGISYYESRHQSHDTCKIIRKLAKLAKVSSPMFKLLITSPIRTNRIHREPKIADRLMMVEVPVHISGSKQGINHSEVVSSTVGRARKMSETLRAGGKPT